MTALKGRDVERFIKAPDERVVCALVYGPEQGLVHERATAIAKAVVADLNDPWLVTSLNDEDAGDAARITDEAAQQSFLGGRRVVRIRSASARTGTAIASLLKASEAGTFQAAGLVVIEAGDLKKSSALRKACEASPDAAAIACYPEGEHDARTAIRSQLAEENLTLSEDAAGLLSEALSGDRGLLRQEVEKLVLYKGPARVRGGEPAEVTAEDVAACLAELAQEDSFAIPSLALAGDPEGLSAALHEAQAQGTSVIALLRQTENRIMRLLPAAAAMSQGDGVAAAMKRIKPPVFFKEESAVRRQLERWPLPRLRKALETVYRAEAACKRTGAPDQAIAERALLSLAARGRR